MSAMSEFARTIYKNKYSMDGEEWPDTARRVVSAVVKPYLPDLVEPITKLVESRKFLPGGRYLYAAGRSYPQVNNCFLFTAEDSRDGPGGWGDIMNKCTQSLMTGGGIGVVYSRLRKEGSPVRGMGGKSTGPLALMRMVNEVGRYIMQGGSRRSAIWAGLHWNHPDVFKFVKMKNWSDAVTLCKEDDFNFPAPMDGTNVSVILDDEFFEAYGDPGHVRHELAHDVYWSSVRGMLASGEPGFSVDVGENAGEHLRNACTEVTSRDDEDMCNLGSVNLARVETADEFRHAVEMGTAFLLCGTLYSKLPVPGMYKVREKNRRLGLGLMGVHEWLLKRGRRYGPDQELGSWLEEYRHSGAYAHRYADRLSCSRPVATRAVAPNGTIGIVAETTTSGEPIFSVAYKRRYLDGQVWKAQYVVDPTAKRLVDEGVPVDLIEDATTLAADVERRMSFQAWLQGYVDHGISSTINLPAWGNELNDENGVTKFGNTLLKYLPRLRGVTAYPDGSRGGQPIVPVSYREAVGQTGVEFLDGSESNCKGGVCGA